VNIFNTASAVAASSDDSSSPESQSDAAPADRGDTKTNDGTGLRSLVLVGLMGAGKSSVGRRLAAAIGFDFVDADIEIEKAAGATIPEIFATHGEAAFRDGERKVIARLLEQPRIVLATGGGAYMNAETRQRIREKGVSIWLKADLDVLVKRCARRNHRPLLQNGDVRGTLERLMHERYPVYAEADYTVISSDGPHENVVAQILAVLPAAYRDGAAQNFAASSKVKSSP
jgi:shikimate kinase